MEESILNNKWAVGTDSSQDAVNVLEENTLKAAPKCELEKTTKSLNHLFGKLKVFFAHRYESLKDLIDEMSLYPERRL